MDQIINDIKNNKCNKCVVFWKVITHNEINDVVEALKVNTTLKELTFWDTDINDEDVILLADALKVNTTLKKLFLPSENISNIGVRAIELALKVNTSLKFVWLEERSISEMYAQFMKDGVLKHF